MNDLELRFAVKQLAAGKLLQFKIPGERPLTRALSEQGLPTVGHTEEPWTHTKIEAVQPRFNERARELGLI